MELRDYQVTLDQQVRQAWSDGARNVLMVSPTGSGKTHTKTHISMMTGLPTCNIAHRQELVLQISESLASFGIYHNIIAPSNIVKFCAMRHVTRFGRSYYSQTSPHAVAGVRTLLSRAENLTQFLHSVRLWDIDEAHHVLADNQWGQATRLFPNAIGLGVTATPLRCDRKGLDGVFDTMIVGPSMRDLINQGHLSDYRIFCPPQSINTAEIRIGASGEYMRADLQEETERSTIVGDVVEQYLKIAPGKRGLTFAVNVDSGAQIADRYNAAGVPAAMVTAKTPDSIRTELLDRLQRGDIKQLVNVDLFGEGMDCPALEVVSMARPTQSYGLYVQQFGRVLRLMDGKVNGIVIDHVGNVVRHGLPDAPREWSMAAPEGTRATHVDKDEVPITTCTECFRPYHRNLTSCPHCGAVPVPAGRSTPEQVDGDLIELDPGTLAEMRGEANRLIQDFIAPRGMPENLVIKLRNIHIKRRAAQEALRYTISQWAGVYVNRDGESIREVQKRFYLKFGIDVMSAQALNAADSAALMERIND